MFNPNILRRIAQLVLITFTSLTLQPLQAAVQAEMRKPNAKPQTQNEAYAQHLHKLNELLEHQTHKQQRGENNDKELKQIRSQRDALNKLETQALEDFDSIEQHLKQHNLPREILARHQAAVAEFKTKQTQLKQKLQAFSQADDANDDNQRKASLQELTDFLKINQKHKTHTASDPNNLPFGTPKHKVRKPIESEKEFKTSLFKTQPVHLAGPIPNGFTLPATELSQNPSEDDLAETEDITLTPEIKALALSLNNNPVQIQNWVRNNIEFIPSYGSIQGAEMTLQTKRGNSFDTASLLIALLRAAHIPARYVYGTIRVPVDQAMNWVGGVTTPGAVQSLMGQGGIPNVAINSGGQAKYIMLEHVWVEAFVDYVPSRGAVNKVPDSWVVMDASFKQYEYKQGMDIKNAVPIDAQALLNQVQTGATISNDGWVQNLNSGAMQTALGNYQTQVQNYISTTNPNATVGDVLGQKSIIPIKYTMLAGSLPYTTVATGGKFTQIPDQLRWKFRTGIYWDKFDYASEGSATVGLNQNTAKLAGKKITLSFTPASQADTDLINSYLPKPHADGTPIQPSELPSSLPGYLIHLTAEVRVDGQVVMQGGNFTMGQELLQATAMFNPSTQSWEEGEANHPIAGEYHAIGLDLQGVSANQLVSLKTKLEATKNSLEQYQANPTDTSPVNGLTKEDLSGNLLYSGILTYFASVDGMDKLIAKTGGEVINYRSPSYGTFLAHVQTYYFFGIPRNVTFPGVVMDVDRVSYQVEAKDESQQKRVGYLRQAGIAGSSFEHATPERMFTDPTKPLNDPSQPQGVSAAKALAVAASQGQKIYTLNTENQANHAALLAEISIDSDARSEIQNALATGKEVTVHQSPINQNGWSGSGYIVLDPETGAGAYKISGGANGGILDWWGNNGTYIGLAIAFASLLSVLFTVAPVLVVILAALSIFAAIMNMMTIELQVMESGCPHSFSSLGLSFEVFSVFLSFFGAAGVTLGSFLSFVVGGVIGGITNTPVCRSR